ncbi:MAG: acyl-CoA dehydrogenase family protein [Actinomycetota bacterium]|nr:acyl-CoA dehydrogenase family protein [Actinomycetota bacterium]
MNAIFEEEHLAFGESVRQFIDRHIAPNFEEWEKNKRVDRSLFIEAGKAGFIGVEIDESFGGGGVKDFRYNAVLDREIARSGFTGAALALALQNDVVLPYFSDLTNEEQKKRWLPKIVSGQYIIAIAMTEPNTGSDLAGIRTSALVDGDEYVINGSKTFISNGQNADLVVVAVRTSQDPHKGLSLIVVERDTPGFTRGRNLDKIGLASQDTSELFFENCRVPRENLLGDEGQGFYYLVRNLPQERLSLALGALGAAEGAFEWTVEYIKERKAFGVPIGSFQNSRFTIADLSTELDVSASFVESCLVAHLNGQLDAIRAAKVKLHTTEMQLRVVDRCLQLHGGYGYMREYPIARAYVDARIQTIYGGTSEIMKEIIGRSYGL